MLCESKQIALLKSFHTMETVKYPGLMEDVKFSRGMVVVVLKTRIPLVDCIL